MNVYESIVDDDQNKNVYEYGALSRTVRYQEHASHEPDGAALEVKGSCVCFCLSLVQAFRETE